MILNSTGKWCLHQSGKNVDVLVCCFLYTLLHCLIFLPCLQLERSPQQWCAVLLTWGLVGESYQQTLPAGFITWLASTWLASFGLNGLTANIEWASCFSPPCKRLWRTAAWFLMGAGRRTVEESTQMRAAPGSSSMEKGFVVWSIPSWKANLLHPVCYLWRLEVNW